VWKRRRGRRMMFEGVVGGGRVWLCGDALVDRLGEDFPAFTKRNSGVVMETMGGTRRAVRNFRPILFCCCWDILGFPGTDASRDTTARRLEKWIFIPL
jgi:hypothetical protein